MYLDRNQMSLALLSIFKKKIASTWREQSSKIRNSRQNE